MEDKSEKAIAMQDRCIYCGMEQYGPAVWDISNGKCPCAWCGRIPPVLSVAEYTNILKMVGYKR